jgi:hypothetical protein
VVGGWRSVVVGRWLVVGGWWLVVGGWSLVVGGWSLVVRGWWLVIETTNHEPNDQPPTSDTSTHLPPARRNQAVEHSSDAIDRCWITARFRSYSASRIASSAERQLRPEIPKRCRGGVKTPSAAFGARPRRYWTGSRQRLDKNEVSETFSDGNPLGAHISLQQGSWIRAHLEITKRACRPHGSLYGRSCSIDFPGRFHNRHTGTRSAILRSAKA